MKLNLVKLMKSLALFATLSLSIFPDDVDGGAFYWRRWKGRQNGYLYYAYAGGGHFFWPVCIQLCWTWGYTCYVTCHKNGLYAHARNGIWPQGGYAYSNTWKWYAWADEPDFNTMEKMIDLYDDEKPEDGDGLAVAVVKSGEIVDETTDEGKQIVLKNIDAFMAAGTDSNYVPSITVLVHAPGEDVLKYDQKADLDKTKVLYKASARLQEGEIDLEIFDSDTVSIETKEVLSKGIKNPVQLEPSTNSTEECENRDISEITVGEDAVRAVTARLKIAKLSIDIPDLYSFEEIEVTIISDSKYVIKDKCNDIYDRITCKRSPGCSWMKNKKPKCQSALPSDKCFKFDKVTKCINMGCKWSKKAEKCFGRWDYK